MKFKWTKHCVLYVLRNDSDDANSNNPIFTIKDKKSYVPAFTLSAIDNQKESIKSVYLNEYETKSESKNSTLKYRYFLESNFLGLKRLFVFIYLNEDDSAKMYKAKSFYLPKGITKNYNVIINRKNFYDPLIDSDTTKCFLDYDYIKNH